MKHFFLLPLFLLVVNVVIAQTTSQVEDQKTIELRQKIGIDYSMPDFSTSKIDGNIIGDRLAKMLNKLQSNYSDYVLNQLIAFVQCEQLENVNYVKIEKFTVTRISKTGDTMTINAITTLSDNSAKIKNAELSFTFNKGVSESSHVNDLFSYLRRSIDYVPYNLEDGMQAGYQNESNVIETNSFWDNWYGQVGVDMNLLFPYGYNVKKVFPHGKSYGLNVAVGKWFTPEFGGKLKINWENGIVKNDHNDWLSPDDPEDNYRHGGYITFIGDISINLHHLFGKYNPDRKWNLIVAPRAGGWVMLKNASGAHVLGLGIINTYRLSDRWRLYADVGYHFVSSITGEASGLGHGSNGFANFNVGVEMDLSKKNSFHRVSNYTNTNREGKTVVLNAFWDNWFAQAGVGMSLINPYGTNFANVFPNGKTVGLNVGFGKWFAPEAGLRVGLNWQNGLIVNHHASYLKPNKKHGGDTGRKGFLAFYADYFFNLNHIIAGYDGTRKWNTILFPRMGMAWNFQSYHEECPVVGLGLEQTYRINNRLKLTGDFTYQVTTGGFLDGNFTTGSGPDSNGWFDLNIGVQYDLGKNTWDKPGKKAATSVVVSGHNWPRFIVNTGASVVVAYGAKTVLKAVVKEERPDHSDNKSFPSGHAAMAFAAARSIDKEFRCESIWIPIAGYAAATAVGVERVVNDRHHWYDVVAGAGLGFGAAELTWWVSDKLFGKGSKVAVGSSGNTVDVRYNL